MDVSLDGSRTSPIQHRVPWKHRINALSNGLKETRLADLLVVVSPQVIPTALSSRYEVRVVKNMVKFGGGRMGGSA